MLRTRLTERLGIRHPILLAPMVGYAGGKLAGAVSAAGGLGLIGAGSGLIPGLMEREFPLAGNQRVGVGFINWGLAQRPHLLDQAIEHKPSAIMLAFGDASLFIAKIRDAGITTICMVQTVEMARVVLAQGADIVVAQGTEAGGHGGQRSTLPLVPAVVDVAAVERPEAIVVAAGGITDGRGLAAALMLGAEGVLLGTRFAVTEECLVDEATKAKMVAASGDDTLRSHVFDMVRDHPWPKEFTGRAVANAVSEEWHGRTAELAGNAAVKAQVASAAANGDMSYRPVWAGEGLDMIRAVEPAASVVERLVMEAETVLTWRSPALLAVVERA